MSTAQLEALTYPEIVANTLDDQGLARRCPLDNGRHEGIPAFDLGDLDKLPLELLSKALVQIDLRSLTDLRRVNQRAMEVVDSIMQYQVIVAHAPNSLRGILAIGTGQWITCQKLYDQLCIADCDHCGAFGGYLYLVTCKRVCFFCFSQVPDYLPLPPSDALQRFGLDRRIPKSVPRFRSIPGCYTREETDIRTRLTLVDSACARQAGIALHGSVSAMEQHATDVASMRRLAYAAKRMLKAEGALIPTPHRPPPAKAYDGRETNPRRFLAIVRAPWLDLRTRSLEWGFHCLSCLYMDDPWQWTAKFTAETFHGHFEECGKKMEVGDCPMRRQYVGWLEYMGLL